MHSELNARRRQSAADEGRPGATGAGMRIRPRSSMRGTLREESPERSLSFSAPTSPFLPRFGTRAPSLGSGPVMCQRTCTDAHEFGSQEAVLPLLAAPLSQQVSPVRRQSIAVGPRGSFSDANASNTLGNGSDGQTPSSSSGSSSSNNSVVGGFDGDIDEDSMVLDDATDVSAGRRMSVSTAPRNKAFERLRSLVEEDKRPLATEMEHEGHITRSIRHSSVQDWLRASSSTLSSPSQLASPPPPAAAGDDSGRAGAAKLAGRRGRGDDLIPFPTSPASSAVSSPRLPAAVASSCPNTAVPNACGAAWHGGGGGGGGGSSGSSGSVAAASRLGKRKSMDDGDERPGDPVARAQGYKRQAMSPSGLRAQIAFGRAKRTQPLAAPPRSGPASPLLLPRPPMAPPVVGAFSPLAPSRARSRSGAALTLNTGSLSVLQTNGVFSRMNIRDSTAAPADDDDDNDDQPKSAL